LLEKAVKTKHLAETVKGSIVKGSRRCREEPSSSRVSIALSLLLLSSLLGQMLRKQRLEGEQNFFFLSFIKFYLAYPY
jgi:hypothetical protein